MSTPLRDLAERGQSPWVDYLSREFVRGGDLATLIGESVTGVTSNPTIFQAAIAEGDSYDEQLREVLADQSDSKEVFLALAREDIRAACDLLSGVFQRGDSSRDGWVSLEVDPNLTHDTASTVAEATRLHQLIGRDNLFVKIPATEAGLPAIEEAVARGIPVNVETLSRAARETQALITVEDHWPEGGLGDAVLDALAAQPRRPPIIKLAVRDMPTSGTPAELLHAAGIDAEAITTAARHVLAALATP